MNYKNILAVGGLCAALAGCGPKPTMEMNIANTPKPGLESNSNYSVTRVGVFEDNLAYDGKRGIYEITDNRTGKKYIGVSGIGISELGSHVVDDKGNTAPDER